jgi:hypothetical protein
MNSGPEQAWLRVVEVVGQDPDDDVTVIEDGLRVKDAPFAFRHEGSLAVDLPPERAADLEGRGIARPLGAPRLAAGRWMIIDDPEDWVELASEAHQYVGEPHVGRES